jgi:cation transport ATPase
LSQISSDPNPISAQELLSRPVEQRIKEHKYRCAQAIVFGLPVLGLQWFGRGLGGSPQESQRWVSLLQALLAGWATYVGAAGMLAEGVILRRVTADLWVAVIATFCYVFSLISVLGIFMKGQPLYGPLLFHVAVLVLAGWTGFRWWQLSRRAN